MARLRFSKEFRTRFSDKLMDLGNFIAVGLIIAQFAEAQKFSVERFVWGLVFMTACYIISYIISR